MTQWRHRNQRCRKELILCWVIYSEGLLLKTKYYPIPTWSNSIVSFLSSFVVESQPSMPQGKGPLVLRTNVQFSVKTRWLCVVITNTENTSLRWCYYIQHILNWVVFRLLVKFPELNHSMKVNVTMDRYLTLGIYSDLGDKNTILTLFFFLI